MAKRWRGFRKFLWNGETKEFLGRGGKSWAQISLFYLVFYTCLAAFWACMLLVFMQTIDYSRPKWVSYVSTPSLVVTPSLIEERISYTPSNEKTFEKAVKALDKVWDSLSEESQKHTEDCSPLTEVGNKTEPRYCRFDRSQLGQWCTPENHYGYNTTEPCVFINMNRVWGWTPEDPEDLNGQDVPDDYVAGHVLVSCRAYKDKDKPGLNGTRIYPPQGLPFAYFPYIQGTSRQKQSMYVSPYVALRVTLNAAEAVDTDIKVLCQSYTGNIDPRGGLYDVKERSQFTVIFKLGKTEAN